MPSQTLTRRNLLALGLGVAACQAASTAARAQPAEGAAVVAVETSAQTGLSHATWISPSGATLARTPLNFRAHGLAAQTQGPRVAIFPRRPGNRFALMNRQTLEILSVTEAPPNRHFFGHGAFSRDGKTLLVTENNLDTLQGTIALYDTSSGAPLRRAEVPLPAAGPHEITRAPGTNRFYIALGGLETHPDYGRTPFNLSEFRSQILALDLETTRLEPLGHWPGTEGLSLRHLAVDATGALTIGAQIKDPSRATSTSPTLWRATPAGAEPIHEATQHLGGYVSSVASSGTRTMVSSRTTGKILTLSGTTITARSQAEGASALALTPKTTAQAGFTTLSLNQSQIPAAPSYEYDNHALAIPTATAPPHCAPEPAPRPSLSGQKTNTCCRRFHG